jgi:alpha 1,3-glucosidase
MFWFILASLAQVAVMVKQEDFKTCAESSFCTRQKAFASLVDEGFPSFWSVEKYDLGPVVTLECADSLGSKFTFKLTPFEKAFRLSVGIDGAFDKTQDYAVETMFSKVSYEHQVTNSSLVLSVDQNKVVINTAPKSFKIEFWRKEVPVMVFNNKGYLYLEKNRSRQKDLKDDFSMLKGKKNFDDLMNNLIYNSWDESFRGKTDSKPKGRIEH